MELLEYFETQRVPQRLVGAEYELAGYDLRTAEPLRYFGDPGIATVLERIAATGWVATTEDGNTIALHSEAGALTIEPGGQLELSTPPRRDAVELARDAQQFRELLHEVSADLDIGWVAIGMNPFNRPDDIEIVPKKRYGVMTDYLKQRGRLSLHMMRLTQSVHVTYDYNGEAEVAEMARTANLASPILAGVFAHSPICEGKEMDVLSHRTFVWRETDPDRCGLDRDAIEGSWSYQRYLDRLLDTPLIFVLRDGTYHAAHGMPAREFFDGKFEGVEPRVDDLEWVINQTFPDVRIRHYIEMRAADMPPLDFAPAIAAVWAGLLYDEAARSGTVDCLKHFTFDQVLALQLEVARKGLCGTAPDGQKVCDLATAIVDCAAGALERRGFGEQELLDPIRERIDDCRTPADDLLEVWHGPAAKDPLQLLEFLAV